MWALDSNKFSSGVRELGLIEEERWSYLVSTDIIACDI